MNATVKETLAQLKTLGNEKLRAQTSRKSAGDNQFGVQLGDIRKLPTKIKTNHAMCYLAFMNARMLRAVFTDAGR